MKYFSMFSGVGGFEYGIEAAHNNKYESEKSEQTDSKPRRFGTIDEQRNSVLPTNHPPLCIGFSEVDKYATAIYKYHYPTHKNYGDATKINPGELPDFDMLVGGFPCQAFSIAGKRRGFEDTRGTLFFDIARIIKAKRPKIVLLENVKGLLNHDQGKTFRVILQTMGELGYDTQWMVVNSKFFGVPQNRERTIIIGSIRGTSRPEILPFRETNTELGEEGIVHGTLTEAMGRQGSSKEYLQSLKLIHNVYGGFKEGIRKPKISPTIRTPKGGGHLPMVQEPSETSYALDANYYKGTSEKDFLERKRRQLAYTPKVRRLTPVECERLQAFPDRWTAKGIINGEEVTISDTQRYKTLGNAVTTKVIQAIVEKLL